MNIPEEFGSYLLLKKLSEDALGETFRAAKVGARGMEQVVLLRVINGKGIDGAKVWQKVSGGAAIQQALRSPNIGSGADLNRVRNLPFVAYDYISGKNLATLFAQAERRMSPIPTDHALLIVERVALALAVASETKVQGERILHGFVVPHLVMISNEGEARLLGFEIGAGLREAFANGWRDPEVARYLAPEAAAGAPLSKADDSWSLGVILFELLTGESLPAPPPEGFAGIVDRTVLAHDGTPIAPPVADLIKRSLLPREQRVSDAVTWHKAISKLMIDGHFSPTTFNLAFFMHNLFREDIERESQEMQAEKKLDLRAPAPVPAAAPAAPVAGAGAAAARESAAAKTSPPPAARSESKGNPLLLPIAALVLLGLAGGGVWYWMRGRTPAPAPAAAPAQAAPAPAQPSVTPAQIQAQIDQLVQAQIQASESKIKQQYDDRLKLLQKQLEDSRRPSGSGASPAPAQTAPEPAPEPKPAASRPVEPTPVQAAPPPASTPASEKAQPAAPEPAPVESAPAPAPAAPRVQTGDLVRPGPGVQTPKLVRLPQPNFPAAARRLNKAATVDVKVLVDERGKVLEAEQVGLRSGFGFDEAAVDVARRAVYSSATKDGVHVKMWTVLRVAFKP
ncbi:MAG TPA: TonB family protein [Thermoanaerobaculia bacterium]|nr:TonB family protein [Thermoanaerobaculia bacterium]